MRGIRYWHERLRHGHALGELASGLALGRAALGIARGEAAFARAPAIRLGADGAEARERPALFALATTMQSLFLGIRPFWARGGAPIACTLVDAGAERFLRRLPALLRGDAGAGLTPEAGYESFGAERLVVELDEPWALDGELFDLPGRLELDTLGPIAFVELERLA